MGYRVGKFQGTGVEGHSFYSGIFRIIEVIPQKRGAQIFHMDPDLVGPACFQRKADERTAFPGAEGFVMGYGFFSFFKVYTAEDSRIFFPGDGRIYCAFGRKGRPPGDTPGQSPDRSGGFPGFSYWKKGWKHCRHFFPG